MIERLEASDEVVRNMLLQRLHRLHPPVWIHINGVLVCDRANEVLECDFTFIVDGSSEQTKQRRANVGGSYDLLEIAREKSVERVTHESETEAVGVREQVLEIIDSGQAQKRAGRSIMDVTNRVWHHVGIARFESAERPDDR